MVYECEECNTALPAGSLFCPKCGEKFDEAVPADAELPKRGFRKASTVTIPLEAQRAAGSHPPLLAPAQILGLLGAAILFVGAFTPILSVPIVGSINYFQNGKGDGAILVVLALTSAALVLLKRCEALWVTSALSLSLLGFSFLSMQARLSAMSDSLNADLADNPFKGIGTAFVQGVQIQWGWALLIVGALVLLAGAALAPRPPSRHPLAWPAAAGLLFLLLTGGAFAYTQNQKDQMAAATKVKADQKVHEADVQAQQAQQAQAAADAEEQDKQEAINHLHLVSFQWQDTEFSRYLVGTVHNGSDRDFSFVSVNFDLIDNSGDKVGTAEDLIENLSPGQTWQFKAIVANEDPIRAVFNELKGSPGDKVPGAVTEGANPSSDLPMPTSGTTKDPVSAVGEPGSGLSDKPLDRNALQNSSVTESDLTGKSLSALSISYNTIYAVHGYIFQKQSLKSAFGNMPWYHPNSAFKESDLTTIERANLKTIRDYERKEYHY